MYTHSFSKGTSSPGIGIVHACALVLGNTTCKFKQWPCCPLALMGLYIALWHTSLSDIIHINMTVLSDNSTKGEGVHMYPSAYDTMNNYSNIIQIL